MQTIGNAYLDRTTNERKTHGRRLKRKPCLEAVILSAATADLIFLVSFPVIQYTAFFPRTQPETNGRQRQTPGT